MLSTLPAEDERFEREAPNVDEALARSFKKCVSFCDEPALESGSPVVPARRLRHHCSTGENTRMAPSPKWHLKTKSDGSKKARIVV